MMLTTQAVYEGGVLRPVEPLSLPEGKKVDVVITDTEFAGPPRGARTPAEEEYARRVQAAKSVAEMHAVMGTAPPDDMTDIVEAINESRRQTGFRMLLASNNA